jgi:transposase-like protein
LTGFGLVWFGQYDVVVGALGINREGDKVVLDFEPGASEKTAVAKALVARLQARGFGPIGGYRLLVVLDGPRHYTRPLDSS